MNIVVSSPDLVREHDNITFYVVDTNDMDELQFRSAFRIFTSCSFFVVHDLNFWSGVLAGYCLTHDVPVIGVETGDIYGSYGNFSREFWDEFLSSINEESVEILFEGRTGRSTDSIPL